MSISPSITRNPIFKTEFYLSNFCFNICYFKIVHQGPRVAAVRRSPPPRSHPSPGGSEVDESIVSEGSHVTGESANVSEEDVVTPRPPSAGPKPAPRAITPSSQRLGTPSTNGSADHKPGGLEHLGNQ